MALSAASRRAQRGMALLGLLAVAVMVFAYVLTSRLNAASRFVGTDRDHNAKVLGQAKRALIGWIAISAAGTDNNPGRLPCPQAWGDVGSANEGRAAPSCSVPAAGWLPWRTLGLEKPLDASGNQIWYVISPGWHLPSAGATLSINPDTPGQLALDGQAAVALLIAPGPPLAIAPNANQLAAGCTVHNQSQVLALPGTAPIPLDFLDCQNGSTADNVFVVSVVDNATNEVFNDQVLAVTAADVIPALEAAVADRMQREIAPALRNAAFVLNSSSPRRWVSTSSNPPIYPYAAPLSDPATSNFQGQSGTYQGLLPFAQASGFVDYESTPTNAVEALGNGYIGSQTCSWESAGVRLCEGIYHEDTTDPSLPMRIQMTATFLNVAMGFRTLDTTRLQVQAREDDGVSAWGNLTPSYSAEMNDGSVAGKPRGSVTIRFWADLPNIDFMGWITQAEFRIRIERAIIADHCLLSTTTTSCGGADISWFARNQWYRNLYYAVAQQNTAYVLPSAGGCTPDVDCVRYVDPVLAATSPLYTDRNIRVLLVLAGRKLDTQARPPVSLSDYLEYQNADGGTVYEQRSMRMSKVAMSPSSVPAYSFYAPWNDRIVLVDGLPDPYVAPKPLRVQQ